MTQKKQRVLIIDDEDDLNNIITMRLEKEGFEIERALDGEEGIEKAKSFKPDCILLDVSMPVMTGWEVCEKLRADPETQNMKIYMFTATRDLKLAKKVGADRVILKPFNYDEIISILESTE